MFNFYFYIGIPVILLAAAAGGCSLGVHFVKHPETVDKWLALFSRFGRYVFKKWEYTYVKRDVQSVVNGYIARLTKQVPNLLVKRVTLEWVDENITAEQFVRNEMLVMRMHKSNNQDLNIVNATFTFVSHSLLVKAKSYIAKYQKNAIDLYVSYKILESEKVQLLQTYVQEILKEGLSNEKTNDFYGKFFDIDRAGIFFPVFLTEMTFLGEKVFGNKRNDKEIFDEVSRLVIFLYKYANRKLHEESINEFDGQYCKFAIRIVGMSVKIHNEGEGIYIRNIQKIPPSIETIYIIGGKDNRVFIDQIVTECQKTMSYDTYNTYEYPAILKDAENSEYRCNNYLTVLRSRNVKYYHK